MAVFKSNGFREMFLKERSYKLENKCFERHAAIERAREEARMQADAESAAKIAALEDKLKAQVVAASPHMERFRAHLEAFQGAYRRMLDVVADAEESAPEVAVQLRRVMDELVKRLVPSADGAASSSTASGPPSPTGEGKGERKVGRGGK